MDFILTYIIPFAVILGILVLVHEFGHFIMAKIVGIRVERFSIGFPPRLFGKKFGDTDYCISAIPLGGYVKMSGMIDESMDQEGLKGEPWEFMSKPLWARFLAIIGGPGFNFIFAAFVFAGTIMYTGMDVSLKSEPPIVGGVIENYPADEIGLQRGDRIVSINGEQIKTWTDITTIIHPAVDQDILIKWERNGTLYQATVAPREDTFREVGLVGIEPMTEHKDVSFFPAIGYGFKSTYNLTGMMLKSFGMLFTGKISVKEGLGGPVRIAQMTGETAKAGFMSLLGFAALLSVNLGLINLFPIPALDGGHLILLGAEGIMRKPVSTKAKMIFQQIGMAIIFGLMIFVFFNDIMRLVS